MQVTWGVLDSQLKDNSFFCGCGWNICTVMADGTVMGCPIFEEMEKHSEGNIRDINFIKIWENGFQRFRKLKLDDNCNSCKHLNACRGGCWMMRIFDAHCLKSAWEPKRSKT